MRTFIFALVLFSVSHTSYVSAQNEHRQRAAVLAVVQTMLEEFNRDDRATMAGLFLNKGLFILNSAVERIFALRPLGESTIAPELF